MRERSHRWARLLLPVVAVSTFIGMTTLIAVASIDSTLGYDFQAYLRAAQRVLEGGSLYDSSVETAGAHAVFLYPPPFVFLALPLTWLPESVSTWIWVGAMAVCFATGTALLPVRPTIRWMTLLLGAVSWPVLYAIKLGQVGPLLYLLFAIGWRSLEQPVIWGLSVAAGSIIKVQPGLLVGWALLTRRWRAAATALAALGIAAVLSTVVLGWHVWPDYVGLLGRVNEPISTPHNFTVGAIAVRSGVDPNIAGILQAIATIAVLSVSLLAIRWATPEVSYLTVVVATQLLSPVLWDHYAIITLLPTAWLLDRRQWWAAVIPIATSVFFIGDIPDFIYPVMFGLALLCPALLDIRSRPAPDSVNAVRRR